LRALRRWISGSVDNFGPLSLDHCMRLNRVALHGVIIRISFFSDHSLLLTYCSPEKFEVLMFCLYLVCASFLPKCDYFVSGRSAVVAQRLIRRK
jgi:hypothetical protein